MRHILLVILFAGITVFVQGQCTLDPPLDLGPDTSSCSGGPVTFNAGSEYISYLWNTGDTTASITVSNAGTYFVRVTDSAGCVGSDSIHYGISTLDLDLGPDLDACEGDIIILTAPSGGYTYLWQDGTTDQSLAVIMDGVYSVTVVDQYSCEATDTVNINFHSYPVVTLPTPIRFCEGESDTLDAGAGFDSYAWNSGETTQSIVVTTSGFYNVTVTNQYGCASTSNNSRVTAWEVPAQPVITGDQELLTTDAGFDHEWFLEGVTIAGADTNTWVPLANGNYSVQITTINGCVSPVSEPIFILLDVLDEDIPQFISPNGDGKNDTFVITDLDAGRDNELVILNRWGQEVFRMEGYDNSFNGQLDGKDLPDGTYYYIFNQPGAGLEPVSGFFHIAR